MALYSVTGSFTASGAASEYFEVSIGGRKFNLTISGTFTGSVTLERSFDAGSTWHTRHTDTGSAHTYTAPVSLVVEEPETAVRYRLNCTAVNSGGTISWRMSA